MKPRCTAGALVVVLGLALSAGGVARADLPPPPGRSRVGYAIQVTGSSGGIVLVAFPTYVSGGGHVERMEPDKPVMLVQGYRPGIYSLPAADAASLAGKGDDDAIRGVLAAKGHVCVKQVPRVYDVATETRVTSITDVFRVEATASDCRASLVKTLYAGDAGERGEGTVDAAGRRLPPAPFGRDLPLVEGVGFPLGTGPADAKPSDATRAGERVAPGAGGCAGCATSGAPERGAGALAILAVGMAAARRARRRRGAPSPPAVPGSP